MGPNTIIITSTELIDQKSDCLYLLCSNSLFDKKWMIEIPKLKTKVSGTGDLFNSLFLGYLFKNEFNQENIGINLEKACNAMHEILKNTGDKSELSIVESQESILEPGKFLSFKFF